MQFELWWKQGMIGDQMLINQLTTYKIDDI
jgi:hypothetical protein